MKKNEKHLKVVNSALFIVYLLILVWVILFKLQFSLSEIDYTRNVNLIPFHYSTSVGKQFHIGEIRDNVLIFIPFGIFLSMLAPKMKVQNKLIMMSGTSLAFEIAQYVLAIGGTDITDVMSNTLGGAVGLALYALFLKIVKNRQTANVIISVIAGCVTISFLGLVVVLLQSN